MKISELIHALQQLQEQHGDLAVVSSDSGYDIYEFFPVSPEFSASEEVVRWTGEDHVRSYEPVIKL